MACYCNRCGTVYEDWVYWSFSIHNKMYKEIVNVTEDKERWNLEPLFEKYPNDIPEIKAGHKCCAMNSCGYLTVFVCIGEKRNRYLKENIK